MTVVAVWATWGTLGITALVIPANSASRVVGSTAVENPALTAAKPPRSPATGWRPTALKASAASGGTTRKEESAMIEADTPTNATA